MSARIRLDLTSREQRLVSRLRTPLAVQQFLNRLPYNQEPHGRATLRSFRGVVRHGCAHCLEAALFAATVLEQHGFPPLVLSFESIDQLDHVLFAYQWRGRWGSVARSRDPGLHGRKPVFASPRALALSYFDPYIDDTGRITGYAVVDLAAELGRYDWRLAETNVWKAERVLLDHPHRAIASSDRRVDRLRSRYRAYRARHGHKPIYIADASGGRNCRSVYSLLNRGRARSSPFSSSASSRSTSAGAGGRKMNGAAACVARWTRTSGGPQSRSKSRTGLVIGSSFACRSASSNRLESASPRVFSASTDC